MATLTYAQLEGVWQQAAQGTQYASQGWAALMAAIAEAESGGDPNATNPTDKGGRQTSWGLWQISDGTHAQPAANWNNPLVNAQLAVQKLQSSPAIDNRTGPDGVVAGLGAWGTYNSGAYKAFISNSTSPDNSALTDATLTAATSAAAGAGASAGAAAQADCAWKLSWGGVLGVGGFNFCVITDSQVRGLAGVGLLVGGGLVMFSGLATVLVAAGISVGSKVPGIGRTVSQVLGSSAATGIGGFSSRTAARRAAAAETATASDAAVVAA